MARPRKNQPPDRFTSTEMAVAGDLSTRSFGVLVECGLAPKPHSPSKVGKSGSRFWDEFGVGEVALIGAIHKGGADLLIAAKIAHVVIDDFVSPRGHLPSGLPVYLGAPYNTKRGYFPWEDVDRDIELRVGEDFWLHHLLITKTDIYRPGIAMDGDLIIEIVDRRYVFTDYTFTERRKLSKHSPWGGSQSADEPEMALEIEGWEGGRGAVVRPVYELLGFHGMTESAETKAAARKIEATWLAARRNALGTLRVNVSLAIRKAFDAIHAHRVATRASIDWTATARPAPSRYDGADEKGCPLDPEHPRNRDLPPLERAKRLVEIEEYIAKREAAEGAGGAVE